jgi:hypothetical protein
VEWESKGPYCRGASEDDITKGRYSAGEDASERQRKLCVFSGRKFMDRYEARRAALQTKLESGQGGVGALLVNIAPRR